MLDTILAGNPKLDTAYHLRDSLCQAYGFKTKQEMKKHLLTW